MDDLISVIITTYKREYNILKRSIDSVLNQTYNNIEIIVVNDTPSDLPVFNDVSSKISEYDTRIRYIENKINKGACYSRNVGAKNSSGKYIAFLDDDDEWMPEKIERQHNIFKNGDYVLVSGKQKTVYENKQKALKVFNDIFKNFLNSVINRPGVIDFQKLLRKNIVGGCSSPLILKEAFISVDGFNEKLPSAQDYDLWIRIAMVGKMYKIKDYIINYHIHEGERISGDPSKKIIAYKHIVNEYNGVSKDKQKFLKNKYIIISYCYYLNQDEDNGKAYKELSINTGVITLTGIYYNLKIFNLLRKVRWNSSSGIKNNY